MLVGDDPASAIYVRRKREACEEVGIRSFDHEPDGSIPQEELLELVGELNDNDEVDGILVQLPLPDQIDADAIVAALDPGKDVDGLTPTSAGLLARGEPGLVPCTPQGVMELIGSTGVDAAGKEAVIVGRSNLVGRPLFSLLLGANATVTDLPQPHARPGRGLPARRDPGRRCREAAADHRRHDPPRRDRDRRGHEPDRRRPGGRRRLRGGRARSPARSRRCPAGSAR